MCIRDSNSTTESLSDCDPAVTVLPGEDRVCTVINTVFFEGIPTLSQWGMILLVLSVLSIGMAASRRL